MPALAARLSRLRVLLAHAARSPFESTPVLAVLVAVALAGFYDLRGLSEVLTSLRLPDTDDAMRLVDVRALVAGQGWFDPVQHRFLPPAGVPSHWSRLVDAPLAGSILALTPLLGERLAQGTTAAAWPVLTFGAYALLLFRTARTAFGLRAAWLAVFAACQTISLAGLFMFGRIDHHNVQVCAVFGLVACLASPAPAWPRAATAGVLAALSLAVGLETLPFIAAAGLVLVLLFVREGPRAEVPLAGFGLGLAVAAPVLFAAQTGQDRWGIAACDALSPPWLWLTGGAGLAGLLPWVGLPTPRTRLLAAAGLGAALLGSFMLLFPACLAGPFGAAPPLVRAEWVEKVSEARSVWSHLRTDPVFALADTMPVFLAALATAWLAWQERAGPRGRLLLLAAAMLGTGGLVAQVQIRGVYIAGAFVPLLAGLVLDRALAALRDPAAGTGRRSALFGLGLALLGRFWIAAGVLPSAFGLGAEAAPVEDEACSTPRAVAALEGLSAGLVLAPIDLGPAILLHTNHTVVAAPYHRAIPGLVASLEAFGGDEAAAERAARASGATYLVACPGRPDDPPAVRETFAARLTRDEITAAWLAPLELRGTTPLRAWRIVPSGG